MVFVGLPQRTCFGMQWRGGFAPGWAGMAVAAALSGVAAAAGGQNADAADGGVEFRWPHHGSGEIVLDTRIRDWVLIPIFIIMVFFTMLREIGGRLMNATPKGDLKSAQETSRLQRAQIVRQCATWVPEASFQRRRAFYTDKTKGVFTQPVTKVEKDPVAALSDPAMMMQQQKSMLTVMLPQMVMMGIISYFFSGFVMVKIPMPLSLKFKGMTQRGIDLQTLDVSFVSSFSWYILVSVGISGVMTLIMGRQSQINDAAAMEQQMKMGGAGPQAMDTPKLYEAELQALNMVEHKFILDKAEERLLAMYEDEE